MNILGIEASVARGSISLQCGTHSIERTIDTPRSHAEQLLPCIGEVLGEAGIALGQLDAIAFGRGPGSFIGVRLASAVAQGLAAASGVGLAPISSMAALALQAGAHCSDEAADPSETTCDVVVCLDARMDEVYLAEYRVGKDQVTVTADEQLLDPDAVRLPSGRSWVAVGSGFSAYSQLGEAALRRAGQTVFDLQPRARELLPLAQVLVEQQALVAAQDWRGEYLRGQSAWRQQK